MTTRVEPASLTVEVSGLRLHYLDWRNERTPLVLLHGLTSAAATWARVAERLSDRYHVVALDQRGHGDSDRAPAEGYRTDDYVADLEAFVDTLGLERFILCGQSMGGHNTIAYTARHPERVLCALANDIPPRLDYNPQNAAAAMKDGGYPVYPSIEAYIETRRAMSPLTPEPMRRFQAEAVLKQVEGGYQPKADPNASLEWVPADLWEEARTITRPIFFVRGGQSTVLDAQTLMDMDMAVEPARSITLEQAGHMTFFDMEREWLAAAEQFFAAHAR
jgi:esterase